MRGSYHVPSLKHENAWRAKRDSERIQVASTLAKGLVKAMTPKRNLFKRLIDWIRSVFTKPNTPNGKTEIHRNTREALGALPRLRKTRGR